LRAASPLPWLLFRLAARVGIVKVTSPGVISLRSDTSSAVIRSTVPTARPQVPAQAYNSRRVWQDQARSAGRALLVRLGRQKIKYM
jgi:hypothetical protein